MEIIATICRKPKPLTGPPKLLEGPITAPGDSPETIIKKTINALALYNPNAAAKIETQFALDGNEGTFWKLTNIALPKTHYFDVKKIDGNLIFGFYRRSQED